MDRPDLFEHMAYDSLIHLRSYHPAWRLMAARNAPFVVSFLYREFVSENKREIPENVLINHLEIYMEMIPNIRENNKTAHEYLVEWADDSYSWLRRFYPINSDEIHYDLTSTAQKAIEWIMDLKQNNFIGTESRLILVFELLHQITEQSQTDPEIRIQELERQKAELEKEIDRAKLGEIRVLDSTQIKERFMQAMSMSREILADFRAVEQNLRDLNRSMREKIAKWDKGKGELIGSYFSDQSIIYKSEQGQSFQAFFEFLMSRTAQEDLENTIDYLQTLEPIKETIKRSGLDRMSDDWLKGSSYVWNTIEAMSEQLRRYIDENFIEEERNINRIIKEIEIKAISLAGNIPKGNFMTMDNIAPTISLPFDRVLFTPSKKINLIDEEIAYGEHMESDEALYTHISVNKEELISRIDILIQNEKQVTLARVIEKYPLKYGLTELLTYLMLEYNKRVYAENKNVVDSIAWINEENEIVKVDLPRIVYYRNEGE
ncbi:DUF3375 domain-containing protein [Konateibacter massiliensis]|uniref:DUF3375 domain-containing protein n=1 Tax=Konateibacter massiliensis TaxID=2002841 RepID=UPI0015D4AD91|nr:DUF3375 domain-containing protein [Konateibacter massiliensis]